MEGKGELRGRRASLGEQVLGLPTHRSILGDPQWQKAGEGVWAGAGGGGSHQCQTSGPGSWVLFVLEFPARTSWPIPRDLPQNDTRTLASRDPASLLVLDLPSACSLHVLSLGFWNSGWLLGQGVL